MSQYHPLTTEEAIEFVKNIPGFFSQEARLECREIGDGNLNLVFHITDSESNKSIIAKQALPYVKIVGESYCSHWIVPVLNARHFSRSTTFAPNWFLRYWRMTMSLH